MKTSTKKYRVVSSASSLQKALKAVESPCALDFETTSLVPSEGRVRLVSLTNAKTRLLVDFDQIPGGWRKVAHLFRRHEWIVFNAGFEGRWFIDAGVPKPRLLDVGYLRRAILGGGGFSLARMALWDLNEEISKEQQASNWSSPVLAQEQLDYAYGDADVTWRLWRYWADQIDEGQWDGFRMLNDMWPAVVEMEEAGIRLNQRTHATLCQSWEQKRLNFISIIRELVPENEVKNINSDTQWSDYFAARMTDSWLKAWPRTEKTGQLSMKAETLRTLGAKVPDSPLGMFFDTLADYKTISKYISSFGRSLITIAKLGDGRIHARYNIGQAKTCRFSSSGPNVQQIPRDKDLLGVATSVRRSFIAPKGFKLISLDYSGIELRVLALLSGDEQLLHDVIYGDVHAEVASVIAGKKINKKTAKGKALRSGAKKVSFGIIYGAGATGIATSMKTTLSKAGDYIDQWEERYSLAYNYRYKIMEEVERTRYVRMIDGGTVYMGKRPDLPKCANYPVQRAALSVMAKAIARHKTSLNQMRKHGAQAETRMLATIHDALIDEARAKDAAECLEVMRFDMVQGYADVFPDAPTDNLVEGGTGPNWGSLD